MISQDESPIADFLKRSLEEQNRLFREGLSKCDGISKISQHQVGKALDIYFQDIKDIDKDGDTIELITPLKGWDFWHARWEEMGGKPVIVFSDGRKDNCHFEG